MQFCNELFRLSTISNSIVVCYSSRNLYITLIIVDIKKVTIDDSFTTTTVDNNNTTTYNECSSTNCANGSGIPISLYTKIRCHLKERVHFIDCTSVTLR
ncbi:unnamed protein product [Heterobilharzia americana]|nr:unnamed protein product [Heterobilharzia americana]CAH8435826.1 unnamed protein product [Heterobilharzia americana]